jgi:hypothetical protein
MNRAGPLAQLLWDLATDPVIAKRFQLDMDGELEVRGLITTKDKDYKAALSGNTRLLTKLLTAEDQALDKIWGTRDPTPVPITGWPPPKTAGGSKPGAGKKDSGKKGKAKPSASK